MKAAAKENARHEDRAASENTHAKYSDPDVQIEAYRRGYSAGYAAATAESFAKGARA